MFGFFLVIVGGWGWGVVLDLGCVVVDVEFGVGLGIRFLFWRYLIVLIMVRFFCFLLFSVRCCCKVMCLLFILCFFKVVLWIVVL